MDLIEAAWPRVYLVPVEDEPNTDSEEVVDFSDWKWTRDPTWNSFLDSMRNTAIETRSVDEFDDGHFGLASIERAKRWLNQKHPSSHKNMTTIDDDNLAVRLHENGEQIFLHIIQRCDVTDNSSSVLVAVVAAAQLDKTWQGRDALWRLS